jgi:hypothetical protein
MAHIHRVGIAVDLGAIAMAGRLHRRVMKGAPAIGAGAGRSEM